jgi:hypothetical protein
LPLPRLTSAENKFKAGQAVKMSDDRIKEFVDLAMDGFGQGKDEVRGLRRRIPAIRHDDHEIVLFPALPLLLLFPTIS